MNVSVDKALKDKPPKKRKRPQKGEVSTKEPTRLERQQSMGLDAMLEDLPKKNCDVGTKMNNNGFYF